MSANRGVVHLFVAFGSALVLGGLLLIQDPASPPVDPPVASSPEMGDKPDPRLVVSSVSEPEMPIGKPAASHESFVAALPNEEGYLFRRRDESGRRLTGVVIPGTVLLGRGAVELFGCGEGGKEHETIIRLECDVQALDLALTSSGFRRGPLPKTLDIDEPGQGARIVVLVQWTGPDGRVVTHRSEDLIVSLLREVPMPRVGWTYVAPWVEPGDKMIASSANTEKVLAAASSRSYMTTFRDRTALLDNPLEDAEDDTVFAANYMLLPRPGTRVRIIFRPPTAAEREEIARIEKKILQEPGRPKEEGR